MEVQEEIKRINTTTENYRYLTYQLLACVMQLGEDCLLKGGACVVACMASYLPL